VEILTSEDFSTWSNVKPILVDDRLIQGVGEGHPESLGPSRVVCVVKVLHIQDQLEPVLEAVLGRRRDVVVPGADFYESPFCPFCTFVTLFFRLFKNNF
jgi:hypothetical protein